MRTLVIGKNKIVKESFGYTLLEVLAVITLIGLVTMIIYPQFTISPEKSEIIYIGKLLKSDIDLVREESFSNKSEISILFLGNGYGFMIDETEISRRFLKYQFTFDLPPPVETEPETGEGDFEDEPSPNSEADSGEQNPDLENNPPGDGEDIELEPNQLMFTSKGKCNMYELSWQTINFYGKLKVNPDGNMEWTYERK